MAQKNVLLEVSCITSDQYQQIISKLNQILALLRPDFTAEDSTVKSADEAVKQALGGGR